MAQTQDPKSVYLAAEAAVRDAQTALASFDRYYREQGFDPAQVRAALTSRLTAAEAERARAQFEEDQVEIEREVEQQAARQRAGRSPVHAGSFRLKRAMV